jgi:hypothetical protein
MMPIHFPCVEAGRVRPVCGVVHAHVEWTTAPAKVTCPRCKTLLRSSDPGERRGPLPMVSDEPSLSKKAH